MPIGCDYTTGCTDVEACNYDETAQLDDGSCTYLDECGNCVPPGNTDCQVDCLGVPGGGAVVDDCGDCNNNNDNMDCAGVCDGSAEIDINGDCCGGSQIDDCGECNNNNDNMDCAGVCFGDSWLSDCGCVAADNDGDDCDASILISNWQMWWNGTTWDFELGGVNTVQLNCDPATDNSCIQSNIEQTEETHLDITIQAAGEGFDFNDDTYADLDIELTFGIYINRIVEIGGVEGTCDDIYGDVSNPILATATFDASVAGNGVLKFNFDDSTLPEDIDLFQDVVINGTTYELDRNQDFNAVYQMFIYIESYNAIGYNYDTMNIVVNDSNNQIEAELTIHHDPFPIDCPGAAGDIATPFGGTITCSDYELAATWLDEGRCDDYLNNPSAPDGCCNVAMLRDPLDELTQHDLNYMLDQITDWEVGDWCV